jgi:hypothetical protein
LSSIASALISNGRAYEVAGMTVIKYWYDPDWKVTCLPCDLILAEFPVNIPVWLRLESIITVHPNVLKVIEGELA